MNILIEKEDIEKNIYFIAEMAQNVGKKGMYGDLAGKSDLMGGIFDRWINQTVESVIFNKCILKNIRQGKNVEVVIDFYKYKPKQETTGLAPDVIGLKINSTIIPFIIYDNKWTPIPNKPQIEVKTFKSTQKMVSLRNQGYEGKYLVMVESNFRTDYLLPFFDKRYFSDTVYNQMIMNDNIFIKNNNGSIEHLKKIDTSREDLGNISLLCITEANLFIEKATCCKAGISPIRIHSIEKYTGKIKNAQEIPLINCCHFNTKNKFYTFNDNWNNNNSKEKYLDFDCNNVDAITIIKKNKTSVYIKLSENCIFNHQPLEKNSVYKITFSTLNRAGSKEEEYFLQKELIVEVESTKEKLENVLIEIIKNEN